MIKEIANVWKITSNFIQCYIDKLLLEYRDIVWRLRLQELVGTGQATKHNYLEYLAGKEVADEWIADYYELFANKIDVETPWIQAWYSFGNTDTCSKCGAPKSNMICDYCGVRE